MRRELPLPFDNDDDDAAAMALGRLHQHMAEARTMFEQTSAIDLMERFLHHERDKRGSRP